MQVNVNSSNIITFRVEGIFDVYNRKVTFNDLSTYGGSSGSGRFNVAGISFLLEDQGGVKLAEIDFSDPSKYIVPGTTTSFVIDLSSISFPFLFQTYKIQAAIKDYDGQIYYTDAVFKKICQPQNLTQDGYVPGIFSINPNCVDNVLTIKEETPFIYSNMAPVSTSKSGTLYYPTGTIASLTFTGTPFTNNLIYSGEYRVVCTTVSEYDMNDDIYVDVTYLTNNGFQVTCNNKIADLLCCMMDLETQYRKNCNNAIGKNAKQLLDSITMPFLLGLTKEINGQDASAEAAIIKKTLNCDCGASSMRQNEFNPIKAASNDVVIVGAGGTTVGTPTVIGNTKQYPVSSNSYQVVKGDTNDLAYSISIDTSVQYLVKYKITFNYNTMADYILKAIAADANLVSYLNSLINTVTGISISGLNGKCIIDLSTANYLLTQNVNATTTIVAINTNTTNYTAPANLFASSASTVQSWLNGLAIGTFVVTYSGGIFSILSLANPNVISTLQFGNPNLTVNFSSTNATLLTVLQAIIDYLCDLSDLNLKLSATITLWQVDYNGVKTNNSYVKGTTQQVLNQAIADSIYNIVNTISNLTGVTCTKIKAVFNDYPTVSFDSTVDRMYGTLGGNCASITDKQIATLVIAAVNKYTDVKALFCAINCTAVGACPDVAGISLNMSGTNIGIYGVTWNNNPVASQTVTVKYKLSSSTSYTTATSALVILANGNISGTSPFTIGGIVAGQTYDVFVVNNCGGNGFTTQITAPTGTAYSGSYIKGNILYLLCGGTPATLYTANVFGVGQIVYTDVALSTPLTGVSYIAPSSGEIYTIDSATGEVLADTGSNCATGVPNGMLVGNDAGTICDGGSGVKTIYTNGAFAIGSALYQDSGLTTPFTGYSYVVLVSNGHIYNVNSVTGVILSDTGSTCSAYGNKSAVDNSLGTICTASVSTYYSITPMMPGVTLYTDIALTIPVTGYSYVVDTNSNKIYNLDPVTGLVISWTGSYC